MQRLVPEQRGEIALEAWVGDGRGLHAHDLDPFYRSQTGDGAEHRDPVVAAGIDLPAAQQLAVAPDGESVGGRLLEKR